MRIIASRYLIPKGFIGITLYPLIIVKDKKLLQYRRLLNHEKIHLRQQAEMLVLPFYIWYLVEYAVKLIMYRNTHKAYRNISFEREAYTYENDNTYLQKRHFWSFVKYIV